VLFSWILPAAHLVHSDVLSTGLFPLLQDLHLTLMLLFGPPVFSAGMS
jgi:hypothetical protein